LSSFLRAGASRAISVRSAELALRDGILMPQMKKGIMGGFANPPQETKALIAAVLRRVRVRHQAEAAPNRPRIIALNAPELNQSITLSQTPGRKPRSDPEAQIVRHRKASGLKRPRS
jgi:hypothetical protein